LLPQPEYDPDTSPNQIDQVAANNGIRAGAGGAAAPGGSVQRAVK